MAVRPYNGFGFFGLAFNDASLLTGFKLKTNLPGFVKSSVTFTSTSIQFNLSGLTFSDGYFIELDLIAGCQPTWTSGLTKFHQYDPPPPVSPLPTVYQNPSATLLASWNNTPQYFGYLSTPNQKPYSLCATRSGGCALTSVATALSSFPIAQTQNPAALDVFLRENGAYGKGFIDSTSLPDWCEYSSALWAWALQWLDPFLGYSGQDLPGAGQPLFDADTGTLETLDGYLANHVCADQDRVILKLDENGNPKRNHFILVTGQQTTPTGATDWTVFDPGWNPINTSPATNLATLQGHLNGFTNNGVFRQFQVSGVRVFRDLLQPIFSGITVSANSPVELLIADPQGRLLGNVTAGSPDLFQITAGSYTRDFPLADDDVTGVAHGDPSGIKGLSIPGPIPGPYQLQVTGTETGSFTLTQSFRASDGSLQTTSFAGITKVGNTTSYEMQYSTTPGTIPQPTLVGTLWGRAV